MMILAANTLTDVSPGLIFWTLLTFLMVAFLLRRVAWTPLLNAVSEREKSIVHAIESAKRERAEAEKMRDEQKAAISQARQEAAEAVRKTQSDMEKFRDELMGKARKEAEELKVEARRAIEEERRKAVSEIRGEAVTLSLQIAEKLLSERLDDAKHQQLAAQFVSDLGKAQQTAA